MIDEDWKEVQIDTWIPEKEGDVLSGIYIGCQKDIGENKSNLYTIETGSEKKMNFWGSKVLDGKMMGIQLGQEIKIEFLGIVKPEGKREYKSYKVYVKPLSKE